MMSVYKHCSPDVGSTHTLAYAFGNISANALSAGDLKDSQLLAIELQGSTSREVHTFPIMCATGISHKSI